jgi:glycosyltransferase involved in cell wall biosynthesis
VTINEQARVALADRGIEAQTIQNAFDLDPAPGDRDSTRAQLGLASIDLVVLQPTRAIPRKEVGRGIGVAEELAQRSERPVVFWLTGPAEDGFDADLERLVDTADVDVHLGRAPRAEDAYAAADLVVFPSSWEGFGNPVIEAIVARRAIATASYPVLDELVALGLELFSIDDVDRIDRWLRSPDPERLEHNLAVVRAHFDVRELPDRIAAALSAVGWEEW